METQNQGEFAYQMHRATLREVDIDRGKTKQGRLAEHIFGHLVAEQPFRALGSHRIACSAYRKPVYVNAPHGLQFWRSNVLPSQPS